MLWYVCVSVRLANPVRRTDSLFGQVEREGETPAHPRMPLDDTWVNETHHKARSGLEKLEVELKNYQNNLIKESIRVRARTCRTIPWNRQHINWGTYFESSVTAR
jgi:hypothetical protein